MQVSWQLQRIDGKLAQTRVKTAAGDRPLPILPITYEAFIELAERQMYVKRRTGANWNEPTQPDTPQGSVVKEPTKISNQTHAAPRCGSSKAAFRWWCLSEPAAYLSVGRPAGLEIRLSGTTAVCCSGGVALITDEMRASFLRKGFVVVPDVLDAAQITRGRRIAARMLERKPPDREHRGPYFLIGRFGPAGHPLLDFYRSAGVGEVACELLRPGLGLCEPEFAQLALTLPPWPNPPGGPHVDGLTPSEPDGRPGTFSMLAGVWLTDHTIPHRGSLWIWPGTHLRSGRFLAERGPDALCLEEMTPGPYLPVELGDPVQVTGTAGSVLFAHYLLGHNIGDHVGDERRETVYYRLMAEGHRERWRDYVTAPYVEFRSGQV